jgi:hypothetical protein
MRPEVRLQCAVQGRSDSRGCEPTPVAERPARPGDADFDDHRLGAALLR